MAYATIKAFAVPDKLKTRHAVIVERKAEHAVRHASGLVTACAQVKDLALLDKQILPAVHPAKQDHAKIIAIGGHAQVPVNAQLVQLSV